MRADSADGRANFRVNQVSHTFASAWASCLSDGGMGPNLDLCCVQSFDHDSRTGLISWERRNTPHLHWHHDRERLHGWSRSKLEQDWSARELRATRASSHRRPLGLVGWGGGGPWPRDYA